MGVGLFSEIISLFITRWQFPVYVGEAHAWVRSPGLCTPVKRRRGRERGWFQEKVGRVLLGTLVEEVESKTVPLVSSPASQVWGGVWGPS